MAYINLLFQILDGDFCLKTRIIYNALRCLCPLTALYLKEKELATHHKKLGQVDSRYLKIAERLVCEEFAVALQTAPESIKKRLHRGMLQ